MIIIDTALKNSTIDGVGLFANEFIKKGRIIWEFYPTSQIKFDEKEWVLLKSSLDTTALKNIEKYKYKENGFYIICMPKIQFLNFCLKDQVSANPLLGFSMVANQDIAIGEELFCCSLNNQSEYSANLKYL